MLAARTVSKERIQYLQLPEPAVTAGHALVRVHSVTLCGTDLHIFEDDYATDLPIIQGHEFAGVIEELGEGAGGAGLDIGDQVAVSPMFYCGHCYACSIGRVNACARMSVYGCYQDGAFVEQMNIPIANLERLPAGLDLNLAPLHEPISIAMQAVQRGRATPGEKAVVLGCGPIGLLATLYLSDLGVEVMAADTVPERCALAAEFGAKDTLLVDGGFPGPGQAKLLDDWAQGHGPSLVLEATGAPASLQNAVQLVATAGRVVTVGISDQTIAMSMRTLPVKELELIGSRNSKNLIGQALELLNRHQREAGILMTHRFPLTGLAEAFKTMRSGSIHVGKIAIDMPPGDE